MYAKGLGTVNVATGISLLTPQHDHVLFLIGATLLVSGLAVLAASFVTARHKYSAAE